jgi:hypothetical protein
MRKQKRIRCCNALLRPEPHNARDLLMFAQQELIDALGLALFNALDGVEEPAPTPKEQFEHAVRVGSNGHD